MRIKFFISNLQKHFELTVGALGFSNSVESFLTTLFVVVAELLRSTAGDDDVEEVDEMLSFSGFRGLLNENLLTKRSGLGFGDKTGGLLPDLLVVSEKKEKINLDRKSFLKFQIEMHQQIKNILKIY